MTVGKLGRAAGKEGAIHLCDYPETVDMATRKTLAQASWEDLVPMAAVATCDCRGCDCGTRDQARMPARFLLEAR